MANARQMARPVGSHTLLFCKFENRAENGHTRKWRGCKSISRATDVLEMREKWLYNFFWIWRDSVLYISTILLNQLLLRHGTNLLGLTKDELTKGGPFYFLKFFIHAPYTPLILLDSRVTRKQRNNGISPCLASRFAFERVKSRISIYSV